MNPIRTIIVRRKTIPRTKKAIPLPICPLYTCPRPVKRKERTAAMPGFF